MSIESAKGIGVICSACGKFQASKLTSTDAIRTPRGWKRLQDDIYCPGCWKERYTIKAITIPVVRPLGEGVGWEDFRLALAEAWSSTTQAVNWMMTELYVADEKREGQEKCPKMPNIYLYPAATSRFPDLPAQTVSALENAIKNRYSKKRYEIIWTGESSLPNARYPQPIIAHNQSWSPSYENAGKDGGDKVPCVSVPLLRGKRFLLQLKGGKEFRRQLADFKKLVDGTAIKGELQILRKRVGGNGSDNRNGTQSRDSGKQKVSHRVMIKLVGWFPKKTMKERTGILKVRTDSDCFLIAFDEHGNKIRIWNSDHVRRWISEHRRNIQRWSEDQKAEQRPVASFQSRREAAVNKYRNRINSFIQETAAQIVGVANRMRYELVSYDDSLKTYFGEGRFDWSNFKTYLEQRLDQDGIKFEAGTGGQTQSND